MAPSDLVGGHVSDRGLLEALCASLSSAIFLLDHRNRCTYVNAAAEKLTGFTLGELQGKPLHGLIHHTRPNGECYPIEDCPIEGALSHNVRQAGEEVFVHKDGSFYPVAYIATPVGGEASVPGRIVEVRAIAEEKAAEAERQRLDDEIRRLRGALASEQARLRSIMEQMPAGIIMAEVPSGRVILANPQVSQVIGHDFMPAESIAQYRAYKGFHPDGRPYAPDEWPLARTVLTGEQVVGEQIEYLRGDGTRVSILVNSGPIRDAEGRIIAAVSAFVDITQRRQVEQALRDSEERFRKVFEHSHDAIFVLDPEHNTVLEVNPAGVAMFGYESREDVLATPLSAFHPHDLPAFLDFVRSVHEEGAGWTDEFACRAKPGHLIASEISASSIIVDNRRCLLAMVRDVSERKRAEMALRDSEALLRATYDNVQVGISEIDLDGRFQRFNEAFCRLLGYTREELMALTFADVSHPDDVVPTRQAIDRLRAGDGDSFQLDKRYIHKSGRTVWASLNAIAVRDPVGRPLAFLGAIQDITERKQAEEHRQLLVGELNHRVRNTLSTVQAIVSHTLRSASVEPGVRETLEGRVLALARAHGLLTDENWTGAGLSDVMFKSLQAFGLDEGRPGRISVTGDDVRLKPREAVSLVMAFHELATNAAKYGALSCASGRVDISWTLQQGPAGEQLCIVWHESGGPPVSPPQRKGFGSHLVERGLAQELGGEVRLSYDSGGVVCRITMPLHNRRP